MFRRILVAVDGSHVSDGALAEALDLARDQQAELRIVHVVDTVPQEIPVVFLDFDAYREAALATGRAVLGEAVAAARSADVDAEPELVEILSAHPSIGILEEAVRWSADLIVMGTHGRTGLMHLLLGSVAESVVRDGRFPVLLIKGPQGAAVGSGINADVVRRHPHVD